MKKYIIRGGKTLSGNVKISGAKNSALKLMAASILANSQVTLRNVPDIEDVNTMVEVLKTLKERGINYVYIGQRQGRVNNPDGSVLDPETLLASPHYKPVYHQDRVWVFEITP